MLPILWSFQKTSCHAAIYPVYPIQKVSGHFFLLVKNTVRHKDWFACCIHWAVPVELVQGVVFVEQALCHLPATELQEQQQPQNSQHAECCVGIAPHCFPLGAWEYYHNFKRQEIPDDWTCITHHTTFHYRALPLNILLWFVSKLQAFGLQNPPQMRIGRSFPGANTHLLHQIQPAFQSHPVTAACPAPLSEPR